MAGTRLSGLISGMDTESLITQLMEGRKAKVTKVKKQQMKANVKQDAWKELNTKLKNLQSKYISNMRFSTAYTKKVTKVSNSSAASVITGDGAVNGVQTLRVESLAKTGYMTGAELKGANGQKGDYSALTTLRELGFTGTGSFSVKAGDSDINVDVTENTTISDVLNKLKDAGLNASFDTKNQRFFVSSKESGAANDFSIMAYDAKGADALSKLGLQASLGGDPEKIDKATWAHYKEYAGYTKVGENDATDAEIRSNMSDLIDAEIAKRTKAFEDRYTSLMDQKESAQAAIDELRGRYSEPLKTVEEYESEIATIQSNLDNNVYVEGEEKENAQRRLEELQEKKASAGIVASQQALIDQADTELTTLTSDGAYENITSEVVDGKTVYHAQAAQDTRDAIADELVEKAKYARSVVDTVNGGGDVVSSENYATKVSGQDAVIYLNDAKFTNNTNVFDINGLTITALNETKEGEEVTLTTETDTDGIYDMVKNFLKEYNAVINEMDKLYNAASAKGYEPLTSEEKDAMTDTEVKEWEQKIKDSILRRDENVNAISSVMKEAMATGFEIGGKTFYLADFGIGTLGYFNAADNEKNAYHIDGDPDDSYTAGNADKLKSMIASDSSTVISFFTKLSQNLYDKMSQKSRSVEGYRSFGSFYDDKKMKSDYDTYTSKIADMEKKLNDYEDKWYKKFAKMESAMAKLQSKTTALSGLFGGN